VRHPLGVSGSVRIFGEVAHVMLAGELDLHSAPEVGVLLRRAVTSGAPSVVVDLALVSFCDAVGLGVLVRTNNELTLRGAELSLVGVPVALRRLLTITALNGALHVAPATTADGLLAADLAAAVRLPLVRTVLDAALSLVVVMSQAVMAGANGVSITLPRDGRLRTVAASDDVVMEMDHDQYDTGEGPCLDAAEHGELFNSTALAREARWPQFVPRARARGIESIMSTPLMAGERPPGGEDVDSPPAGGRGAMSSSGRSGSPSRPPRSCWLPTAASPPTRPPMRSTGRLRRGRSSPKPKASSWRARTCQPRVPSASSPTSAGAAVGR
jgi:anti-anti-sigma factor